MNTTGQVKWISDVETCAWFIATHLRKDVLLFIRRNDIVKFIYSFCSKFMISKVLKFLKILFKVMDLKVIILLQLTLFYYWDALKLDARFKLKLDVFTDLKRFLTLKGWFLFLINEQAW
jgi:hypothetical protein